MRLGIVLFIFSIFPVSVHATLVEQDLFTNGDGLITYDDETNLEWLDVTQTTGLSYNDILADIDGWFSLSFRHATHEEICSLFLGQFSFPCPSTIGLSGNNYGITITNLLGSTGPANGGSVAVGYFDDSDGTAEIGLGVIGFYNKTGPGPSGFRTWVDVIQNWTSSSVPGSARGNFLVRTTQVPEPSTALLLSLGLIGLAIKR